MTLLSNIKIYRVVFSNLPSQNIWTLSCWLSFDKEPEPLAASESQMQANVSSERISSWCLLSSLVSSRSRCSDRWHVKVIHFKYFKHLKEAAHHSHLGRKEHCWFLPQEILNNIEINLHFNPDFLRQLRMFLSLPSACHFYWSFFVLICPNLWF